MSTHLLRRAPERPRSKVNLLPGLSLERGRAHEACGTARHSFALWLAACFKGPVLWITPGWDAAQMNPDGMRDFVDPARFLFVATQRAEDLLWCVEEALRPGTIPLIIADLPAPPALTPVRRMHLAAEQGGSMGTAPMALLLTPAAGGAQGVETRWHMAPHHQGRKRFWQLDRVRARTLPPRSWHLQQTAPGTLPDLRPNPAEHTHPDTRTHTDTLSPALTNQ